MQFTIGIGNMICVSIVSTIPNINAPSFLCPVEAFVP